jgi:hypothetical protein
VNRNCRMIEKLCMKAKCREMRHVMIQELTKRIAVTRKDSLR